MLSNPHRRRICSIVNLFNGDVSFIGVLFFMYLKLFNVVTGVARFKSNKWAVCPLLNLQ